LLLFVKRAVNNFVQLNKKSKTLLGGIPPISLVCHPQHRGVLNWIKEGEKNMKKVVCFGEIMLRLAPEGYYRFEQADKLGVVYGGGEANVSVSLANYGLDARFVTKVPENPIGQAAVNEMRRYGVDTTYMLKGGERLGIYFLEKGASQRPSKVVYDRKYSSISVAKNEDFDWDAIFKDASWFHFTGITPALGDSVADAVLQACKAAKKAGITISCDLNFRKNLWTSEKAGKVMASYMPYVDVCIANEEDAEKVFGIKATNTDITGGKLSHEGYKIVAKKLKDRFNFSTVAITLRGSISASDNNWAAMLYKDDEYYLSKNYAVHIVDRVGGGDSFGGGLIYGLLSDYSNQDALEFAVAASALKHTIEGDHNHVSVKEVQNLMGGDGSGRVQR
jgi:2-dehydro-3-deoxygluconokinase